jgi:hypothetical protein
MFNKILFFLCLSLSAFFLFTLNSSEFLGSSILFYVLTTISIFIILSFFYFYSFSYKRLIIFQLKELQNKNSITWFGWISDNLNEFASIFLFTTPYIIACVSLSKGIVYLFPALAFLNMISIGIMAVFCMFMIFMVISHIFNASYSKKRKISY